MEWYFSGRDDLAITLPSAPVGAVRFMEVQMLMTRGRRPLRSPRPKGWETSAAPKPATLTPAMPSSVTFRQAVTDDHEAGLLFEASGADIFVTVWVEDPQVAPTPEVWAAARDELLGICNRL